VREIAIFMASPGDLGDERSIIRTIEDFVNQSFAAAGVRVRVIGWELTQPGFGRPQSRINPMVHECDVFIGLLNRRWGSETGEFSSGFEEEFEIALSRRRAGNSPAIAMYFAQIPSDLIADPGAQLSRVLAFKERIQRERIALYQEFRNVDHLATCVFSFLTDFVLQEALNTQQIENPQPTGNAAEIGLERLTGPLGKRNQETSIPHAKAQLLETFKGFQNVISEGTMSDSADIDRLALAARSFERQQEPLGTHLVNRLYKRRSQLALSKPEVTLWLRTLLFDIGSTNRMSERTAPGWALLREFGATTTLESHLIFYLNDERPAVIRGAIRLLTRYRIRPNMLWPVTYARLPDASDLSIGKPDEKDEYRLAVQAWSQIFGILPGTDSALNYLVSSFVVGDEKLIYSIATHDKVGAATKDALLAFLATRSGDFSGLSILIPSPVSHDIDNGSLLSLILENIERTTDEDTRIIADSPHPFIRRAAMLRLISTATFDDQILKSALRVDDEDIQRALCTLATKSHAAGEAMLSIVSKESVEYLYGTEARLLAALRTPEELRAMHSTSWYRYEAWHALAITAGFDLVDEAREILDSDGRLIREGLAPQLADHPDVLSFLVGQYRGIACLIISSSDSKSVEDTARLAKEVERKNLASAEQALLALAKNVTAETLPVADKILGSMEASGVREILPKLLSSNLAPVLVSRWRESKITQLRDAANCWFYGQSERTESELKEALYSADTTIRITALDNIISKVATSELENLLVDYPQKQSTYWYNIVAALDEHLYAHPSQ